MSSKPGPLRLKGTNPSGKVSKKKKKPAAASTTATENAFTTTQSPSLQTGAPDAEAAKDDTPDKTKPNDDNAVQSPLPEALTADGKEAEDKEERETEEGDADEHSHKTAAELDREYRRRQRLNHRLEREGSKTHKQRVEELNRYLSGLSEHHDMPRIGPG